MKDVEGETSTLGEILEAEGVWEGEEGGYAASQ